MPSLEEIVAGASAGDDQYDEVDIDFSGAVEFDPIPADDYIAVIEEVEPGLSKQKAPKLTWKFRITEGPHAGRKLMRHTPTTGKGSGLTKQVLKAIGQDTSDKRVKFRPSSAVGQTVLLVVGMQEGTDFNEIKRVKAAPKSDPLA